MAKKILRLPGMQEGEEFELFWICSPKKNEKGNWRLGVFFLNSKKDLEFVYLPLGILPLLRMGYYYIDGDLSKRKPKGNIFSSVTISSYVKGKIIKAIDMGQEIKYYLHSKKWIIDEFIWKFSIKDIDYYVPCIEIIKAYYARSKEMTLAIMDPNKPESYIDTITHLIDKSIQLQLTSEWPHALLKDDDIRHLVWVSKNQVALKGWKSINKNIQLRKTNDIEIKEAIILQAEPPLDGTHTWSFRGLKLKNGILIMEITGISGLDHPFDNIDYASPLYYQSNSRGENNVQSGKGAKNTITAIIDNEDGSKPGEEPLIYSIPMCSIEYSKAVAVKRHTSKRKSLSNSENIEKSQNARSNETESDMISVNAGRPRDFGENRGIEFTCLNIVPTTRHESLNHFLSAINIITQKPVFATLLNKGITNLPTGAASTDEYGQTRECAVIIGQLPSGMRFCVLEVNKKGVSTLLVYPKEEADLEDIIIFALDKLAEKGHWNIELMRSRSDFNFDRFNHFGDHPYKGVAKRINKRLIVQALT
ncbi:MAG: hypothetical protein CVU90_02735 [Firmicutes bacterium HGW-Firmicutes-15]|nr:MAG: hypothetical protein CVU90_02735 [Firmicutes bacterium HGW-Firmicutes-15]